MEVKSRDVSVSPAEYRLIADLVGRAYALFKPEQGPSAGTPDLRKETQRLPVYLFGFLRQDLGNRILAGRIKFKQGCHIVRTLFGNVEAQVFTDMRLLSATGAALPVRYTIEEICEFISRVYGEILAGHQPTKEARQARIHLEKFLVSEWKDRAVNKKTNARQELRLAVAMAELEIEMKSRRGADKATIEQIVAAMKDANRLRDEKDRELTELEENRRWAIDDLHQTANLIPEIRLMRRRVERRKMIARERFERWARFQRDLYRARKEEEERRQAEFERTGKVTRHRNWRIEKLERDVAQLELKFRRSVNLFMHWHGWLMSLEVRMTETRRAIHELASIENRRHRPEKIKVPTARSVAHYNFDNAYAQVVRMYQDETDDDPQRAKALCETADQLVNLFMQGGDQ